MFDEVAKEGKKRYHSIHRELELPFSSSLSPPARVSKNLIALFFSPPPFLSFFPSTSFIESLVSLTHFTVKQCSSKREGVEEGGRCRLTRGQGG